ncbi:3-phosphoshikimate 1-carboxyvinyltransferase [Dysgonomonas sp. PFB1-18]|uniref:3-phosphoshikimate 1-carboxyvinyltransferase n=1 Tax=unclassified Dysgonomonas TaxID=2630389 RepID=UPI002476DBB6|nr:MULTISPECIES: 3-phosphoshikimate 1-carboxyvinyltransferase [unclassified Dysgonomonas]MDH6309114.1 3-phosphoshikimate 1-carboxyvinyltransferase [Dysgonomonas sp. PF1-14]MDH6339006.1 3-phosphoshikimate 1-carboxyvinyltransferase [Dysgonomonas sp. PF1-16]MDH6380363.1 3-phosphoshikimate 1-carboxyvinyltransferase [Dysgonomonas sp. PFB1-18]MDH6397834.1 3-phosphoshikimate 1-carboxyvinyltransferase [Dysgonomonas sp. PF1-23]
MQYKVTAPQTIKSIIQLPASKSISNRALILNALSFTSFDIENLSDCDDTNVMVDAFESGNSMIDVKAAGTSMRFLTAFLSITPGEWIITGTERMKERPIHILVDALISLGARIEYLGKVGYPPLRIKGTSITGGDIYLSGDVSSQFISALLMIAPTMSKGLTIHLEGNVISIPYIKLTLGMMAQYGVKTHWDGNVIKIHPEEYKPTHYKVESDWSAASYWYEMAALADEAHIELKGLFKNSMQGDSKTAELFVDLGVSTEYTQDGVIITKTNNRTKKLFHNFVNEPDLAQTFVVTCCLMNIPFLFTGLQTLKIKETDRIEALKAEMKKLGYVIRDSENSILEWDGERCEPEANPVIKTYEDHRMAMAFAPAAIKLKDINIAHPKVVTKSYPRYWDDLKSVGFNIEEK